jgi:UDP-N-acetylmuramate dehydrogenase
MSLSRNCRHWLNKTFGRQVKFDEPMTRHTYFRVGGPAEAYVSPTNIEDLTQLIRWCSAQGHKALIIGGGSNLLVKDGGIAGIVISLRQCLTDIKVVGSGKNPVVTAQAGVSLQALCRFCAKQGLGGLNFAVGIPGTVGGAILMNAGTKLGAMADVIDSIGCLHWNGRTRRYQRKELNFSYRNLAVEVNQAVVDSERPIIIDGHFQLETSDSSMLQQEAKDLLKERLETQPVELPSAGCFFKNPIDGPSAGELIERCELKGYRIGDAQVSGKHANYIVNLGDASARDILSLMELVKTKVADQFKVDLEPEVKIVGN